MKTYLTREKALGRYPLTEEELDQLLADGGVDTVHLVSKYTDETVFYDDDLAAYVAERDITPEKFEHLQGNFLGINEAGLKYKITPATISGWVKQGVIKVRKRQGQKKLLDEADVAYLATLGRAKNMRPGKKPFDF